MNSNFVPALFWLLLIFLSLHVDARPVRIGVVGSMVGDIGNILLASVDGLRVAVWEANSIGGAGGRPIEVVTLNTYDNESMAPLLVATAMANSTTELDVLALTPGRAHINAIIPALERFNLLLVSPVSGDRQDFESFSRHLALFSPIPDAEVEALIRNLVLEKGVKRIAVATTREGVFGNDLIPYIGRVLAEFGLEIVYTFQIENPTRSFSVPTPSTAQQMNEALPKRPQALLLLGYLYPETAYFLLDFVLRSPDSYIALPGLLFVLSTTVYKQLPAVFIRDGNVIATQYTPSSTDTSFQVVRNLRASYESAKPLLSKTLQTFDADPAISPFFVSGYLVGRAITSVLAGIGFNSITPLSILEEAFSARILKVDDWRFGPLSNLPCDAVRDSMCECNAGARSVLLASMRSDLTLSPITTGAIYFTLDECIQSHIIQSPLIQLLPYYTSSNQSNGLVASISSSVSAFTDGERAAYLNASVSPSSRRGIVVPKPFVDETELETAQRDRLLTLSIGGIFDSDTHSENLTVILDPLYVTPRVRSSYAPRVVHMMATLEQEIHVLASVFTGSLSVFTTDVGSVSSLQNVLRLSVNTFGSQPGAVVVVSRIEEALNVASEGTIFLHGVSSAADISAIASYLLRFPAAQIVLPFHHVSLWYEALLSHIPSPASRSRVVFATNFPNWNLHSSATDLMRSYHSSMSHYGKSPSPRSLAGFLTQRVVANIVERIPTKLTQDSFLTTLYAVSVVVIDPSAFSVGPLSNSVCGDTSVAGTCEVNSGARSLTVRSLLSAVGDANESHRVFGSFYFSSGIIEYHSLPNARQMDSAIIVAIALSTGLVVVIGVAVVFTLAFTGRSHARAPKDEGAPFTIMFTDIQSSTNLWAEIPDVMAKALEVHHRLIRTLISRYRGYEVKTIGDAFMVAFKSADDAVQMAFSLQHEFFSCGEFPPDIDMVYLSFEREKLMESTEPIPALSVNLPPEAYDRLWSGLRVRVGIHTGFGDIKKDEVTKAYDYYGTVTNTSARVEAVSHGGQVCLTKGTLNSLSLDLSTGGEGNLSVGPTRVVDLGSVELRGLSDKVHILQLECVRGRIFPPLRLENAPGDELDFGSVEESDSTRTVDDQLTTPSQKSYAVSTRAIPSTMPHDVHPAHVISCVATLFSILPREKKNKELKRMCDLWRIRIDRRATEKAMGWGSGAHRGRFANRQAAETALAKAISYELAKGDASLAACYEALSRRVRAVSIKSLANVSNVFSENYFKVALADESQKPSIANAIVDIRTPGESGLTPFSPKLLMAGNLESSKSFNSCDLVRCTSPSAASPSAVERVRHVVPLTPLPADDRDTPMD